MDGGVDPVIISQTAAGPTPNALAGVEREILAANGAEGVVWTGRGATALYWAFRAIVAQNRSQNGGDEPLEVILPAITCESVARAACLAGLSPRFADTDPCTGMMTPEAVEQRRTPRTRAIVLTHLYGQTADAREFEEWGRRHGITLIEDAAHALGGRLPDGRPVGSGGDMAIFSFSRTKILECGGGALLVRSAEAMERLATLLRAEQPCMERDPTRIKALEAALRNLEHGFGGLFRLGLGDELAGCYGRTLQAFAGLTLQPVDDPAALAAVWNTLGTVARDRCEKAERYSRTLSGGPWRLLDGWRESGVCWRYSFLVEFPERLPEFIDAIREAGALVSSLYWPLNHYFRPDDECPRAVEFAQRVVNCCVDHTVTPEWVADRATAIRHIGESFAATGRDERTVSH
jgi:dTDP-4-amino-4,6-dideoxygalactose transaminase